MNTCTTSLQQIFETIITRKGQVTIPVDIRRAFRLKEGDKVGFKVSNHEIRLEKAESAVAKTTSAVASKLNIKSVRLLRKVAEQSIAFEQVLRTNKK